MGFSTIRHGARPLRYAPSLRSTRTPAAGLACAETSTFESISLIVDRPSAEQPLDPQFERLVEELKQFRVRVAAVLTALHGEDNLHMVRQPHGLQGFEHPILIDRFDPLVH